MARLAQIALVAILVIGTSGLGRGTVVLADDGCCEGGEESSPDGSDESSDAGCPLPCSDCVCAAYLAPAITVPAQVLIVSAPAALPAAVSPDVYPEVRFLPGVFRPPRHAA